MSFLDQIKSSLTIICNLFSSCIQHYALHCSTDGHFAQLIFGADLIRAHRSSSTNSSPTAITQLLSNHFVSFEEQLGTNVKTLAFFLHDLVFDHDIVKMNINERRLFFINIYEKLQLLDYISIDNNILRKKEDINIDLLINHIFDTLPRIIFDRNGSYYDLLSRLIKHNFDRIDDYLIYNQQLSFITTGSSIAQSRLIDGILLPIHNSKKLLPSFISNSKLTVVFLNIESTEFDKSSSFSIIDKNQEFVSYDTLIYRQFIKKYLIDVNLIISLSFIDELFRFELHQANINIIDSLDEQTFEFLLKVYRCIPCNRLFIAEDESIEKISTVLIDRHVMINQQAHIYLSSNGAHQTLLTCVPTATLILTTQKILINIVRLIQLILEKLNKTLSLPLATEKDYLKYVNDNIPELKHILDNRRIYMDKQSNMKYDQLYPICIFHEYLLNGINFLCYINKIDGIYSTTRQNVVEKC
ncbi:unnamed protein product [Adineta steineri]|uniref:Uncharacterized protein n=1 Tax=Adineta steineri TaxID=433720 RepID=A0A816B0F1_9BILA|nr:unnamed protein product [Adineta steineri]CAF1176035.1 unnamed protein product [Adineta steineri]CAF1366607.1 unnamed protein product [Adineta steineri]CAF1602410.1 unnamed protein product [Adineta steineri]